MTIKQLKVLRVISAIDKGLDDLDKEVYMDDEDVKDMDPKVEQRFDRMRRIIRLMKDVVKNTLRSQDLIPKDEQKRMIESAIEGLNDLTEVQAFDRAQTMYDLTFFKTFKDRTFQREMALALITYFKPCYQIQLWKDIVAEVPDTLIILASDED